MTIFELLDYDEWATGRLMEAVRRLTPAQFAAEFAAPLTSVRQQFVHLLRVSDRYRARLAGEPAPDIQPEQFADAEELFHYSVQMRARLNDYAANLSEEELAHVHEHATVRGSFRATVLETLQHMVNHATYHRGQVACLLKLHGTSFDDTDLIIWLNEREPRVQ